MKTFAKNEKHSIGETLLIIDSAIGLIALPYKDVRKARDRGRSIFDTSPSAETYIRNDELLDAHSIAKRFGMDAGWFLRRAREGRIPHIRMGKYVRFEPNEVCKYFIKGAG